MKNKKILIIGETFHYESGGGITLTNLFENYPSEYLYNLCTPKWLSKSQPDKWNDQYQLGQDEMKYIFPLNLFSKRYPSGSIKKMDNKKIANIYDQENRFNERLINIIYSLMRFLGLFPIIRKFKLSEKLKEWIMTIQPDVVYCQLSNLEYIRLIHDLYNFTNIQYIIHIMDDWPTSYAKQGLLSFYWGKRIDKEFRYLLGNAKDLFCISESMQEEYKLRYQLEFKVFHNNIDVNLWQNNPILKINSNVIKIVYSGRICENNIHSLKSFIKALRPLYKRMNIKFVIYSSDQYLLKGFLIREDQIELFPPLNNNDLYKVLSTADILLLISDFDRKSVSFFRYSMPTKVPAYMASGTPILIVAPETLAFVSHARKHNWAKIISTSIPNEITSKIETIFKEKDELMKIATSAKKMALVNFSREKVNKKFIETIIS